MSQFVVEIEMGLTLSELDNLSKLSKMLGKAIDEVARDCMNSKCQEQIDLLLMQKHLDTEVGHTVNEERESRA
jgi:hypothetical protein